MTINNSCTHSQATLNLYSNLTLYMLSASGWITNMIFFFPLSPRQFITVSIITDATSLAERPKSPVPIAGNAITWADRREWYASCIFSQSFYNTKLTIFLHNVGSSKMIFHCRLMHSLTSCIKLAMTNLFLIIIEWLRLIALIAKPDFNKYRDPLVCMQVVAIGNNEISGNNRELSFHMWEGNFVLWKLHF